MLWHLREAIPLAQAAEGLNIKHDIGVPLSALSDFVAAADTEFVIGSAAPHPYDLVLGYYSVHTSAEALQAGEARIEAIRHNLVAQGRL